RAGGGADGLAKEVLVRPARQQARRVRVRREAVLLRGVARLLRPAGDDDAWVDRQGDRAVVGGAGAEGGHRGGEAVTMHADESGADAGEEQRRQDPAGGVAEGFLWEGHREVLFVEGRVDQKPASRIAA